MTEDIYQTIRENNIKNYGTKIDVYGPVLLANLYSDKTHFVYELIQNAEDACERARILGFKKKFDINFKLFDDRLEVRHNGIPFDNEDLKGICGLVEGTKKEDWSQIGKFGIGFKSVYAYTKSPEIYSGNKSFYIDNYVQPFPLKNREDCRKADTLFVIPLNSKNISPDEAHHDIEKRLKNLGLRTLLFIKNIREVTWQINSSIGKYSKLIETKDEIKRITITYESDKKVINSESWLHFEKVIREDEKDQLKVEIAYLLSENEETGKEQIIPVNNLKLVAYFPTTKPTYLNFLIQGPYNTTPPRDNIHNDKWNNRLIRETGNLIAESIPKVRNLGLLDLSFLKTLPILDYFSEEEAVFIPIYTTVKETLLGNEPLLPSNDGAYTIADQALIGTSKPLRDLLTEDQLHSLFNRNNWLDGEITKDKTPELREYLMNELGVPEIDPERFARNLDEKFIKEQTDDWIIKFYKFLLVQKALWRKRSTLEKEGILRKKPIIRIEDNNLTLPFDSNGIPLAYLPSKDESINKLPFPFVKTKIVDNQKAKEFLSLQSLGLREPDAIAWVLEKVLPIYSKMDEDFNISLSDNIQHVDWISKTLTKSSDDELKQKLMDGLRDTKFIYTKNIGTSEELYRSPNEGIYLGEAYTGNKDIETFFEGNDEIWFLNERYKGVLDVETLNLIGCKTEVQVFFEEPGWDKNVCIEHYQFYKRGLDGFDPECEIDGLEHALKTITIEKAEIIWNILISSQNYKRIKGTIEESTRQDFSSVGKHYAKYGDFSKIGKLLVKYSWLPDKNGDYDKPSNLLLTDLPDEFDKESFEVIKIGEKLGFKTPKEQEIYDQLSNETKRVFDIVNQIFQTGQENKITEILEKIIEQPQIVEVTKSGEEIGSTFINSLTSTSPSTSETSDTQSSGWSGPTPDEEDASETEYKVIFPQELDDLQLEVRYKVNKNSEIKSKSGRYINGKEFLKDQYDGHCQICNTRLDRGDGIPYFHLTHIVEGKHEKAYTDMVWNILCLCPNCHALIKHGRNNDLNAIQQIAISASEHEIVPEPIEERNGDYYIVNIQLAGKERQLFYTPNHVRKISVLIKQTNKDSDGAV